MADSRIDLNLDDLPYLNGRVFSPEMQVVNTTPPIISALGGLNNLESLEKDIDRWNGGKLSIEGKVFSKEKFTEILTSMSCVLEEETSLELKDIPLERLESAMLGKFSPSLLTSRSLMHYSQSYSAPFYGLLNNVYREMNSRHAGRECFFLKLVSRSGLSFETKESHTQITTTLRKGLILEQKCFLTKKDNIEHMTGIFHLFIPGCFTLIFIFDGERVHHSHIQIKMRKVDYDTYFERWLKKGPIDEVMNKVLQVSEDFNPPEFDEKEKDLISIEIPIPVTGFTDVRIDSGSEYQWIKVRESIPEEKEKNLLSTENSIPVTGFTDIRIDSGSDYQQAEKTRVGYVILLTVFLLGFSASILFFPAVAAFFKLTVLVAFWETAPLSLGVKGLLLVGANLLVSFVITHIDKLFRGLMNLCFSSKTEPPRSVASAFVLPQTSKNPDIFPVEDEKRGHKILLSSHQSPNDPAAIPTLIIN